MNLKYLVTGCGRSGTVYLAKVLTQFGVPCGHECLFDWRGYEGLVNRLSGHLPIKNSAISLESDGGEWVNPNMVVADSSYAAAPFLNTQLAASVAIIHTVRNPMKVISSFVMDFKYFFHQELNEKSRGIEWQQFIYNTLPEIKNIENQLERAAYYYVEWNRIIENSCKKKRYLRRRIEEPLDNLIEFLGVSDKNIDVSKTTNSRIKQIEELLLECRNDRDLAKLTELVMPDPNLSKKPKRLTLPLSVIPKGSIRQDLIRYSQEIGYELQ